MKFKQWLISALGLIVSFIPPTVCAQTGFPDRPVRIVVPFGAGGAPDVLGRVIADELSHTWKKPVIVENRTGAAGNIGMSQVAKATPDGYSLVVAPIGNIAINPTLFKNLPYTQSDFAPISLLATVENVLVVRGTNNTMRTLADLIASAKANPGKLSFASPGAGSQAHLAGELLQLKSGTQMLHVPYKGVAQAINDLISGEVTMMFAQVSTALPFVKSGQLNPIGIASTRHNPMLPNVPTMIEQGVPDFHLDSWYALMAPAGTPSAIIENINAATVHALSTPKVRDRLAGLGMDARGESPEALAARIVRETARWSEIIKRQGLSP